MADMNFLNVSDAQNTKFVLKSPWEETYGLNILLKKLEAVFMFMRILQPYRASSLVKLTFLTFSIKLLGKI